MSYDSRDASSFATHGTAARVEYLWSDSALGADREWQRIEAGLRTTVPIGKHVMWATVAAGTDIGSNTLPPDRAFSLGGPQSFPGYAQDELRARRYWTVSGSFLWRLTDLVAVRNEALYGGVQLEAGRVFDRVDPVPDGDVYGLSAYLGGRTPVGTLTLGGGVSQDSWSVWIALGRPIGRGSILEDGLFR
jgi:NTE family protein